MLLHDSCRHWFFFDQDLIFKIMGVENNMLGNEYKEPWRDSCIYCSTTKKCKLPMDG